MGTRSMRDASMGDAADGGGCSLDLVRGELRRTVTAGDHALSIGVFDGVHRGHAALVQRMLDEARARGVTGGIVTFHPHPITVIRPDRPLPYLDSLEQRVQFLRGLGVAFVSVLPFTSELQQVSAEEFARLLVQEARMRVLVVGEDFRLGRGGEGTAARLRAIGEREGFEVVTIPLQADAAGERLSSTRVREALAAGRMEEVARLLGRAYALRGPVLPGDGRGHAIGFPTLNIGVSPDRALPPHGVYVTRAEAAGRTYAAVTNIGTRPTFDGTGVNVETHLMDFEGDLYGQVVTIELLSMLRAERRFAGVEELVAQIRRDVVAAREWSA